MKNLLLLGLSLIVTTACAHVKAGSMAAANVAPTSGSTAQGMVHFQEVADGSVDVTVDLTGVPPGVHGFHVHDKGDCGDNGNAAGGHFNPTGAPHGAPQAAAHHSGDFGNVTADAKGEVHTTFNTRSITVSQGAQSVVGHAVILHANPDDLTTQPTGNAGGRIGCGVTTLMAGEMQH